MGIGRRAIYAEGSGFADALKPEKLDVACFGLVQAEDIRAHAADEFVYVEDLVRMTKQLVHYFAF